MAITSVLKYEGDNKTFVWKHPTQDFFSKITLEDKVGTEFEPYIFAALHSAKVMVVVGTSRENLDSVWVKNEWSRFLALMKKDKNKVLLPCYKDMNPYDMPEALSVLQSYNMASIGFMQDLVRGIEKILKPIQNGFAQISPGIDISALKKRIHVFLDNRDFKSANEYCDKVLDVLPEDGETYALKLCSEVGVDSFDKLQESKYSFESSSSYSNAIRFSDEQLKDMLENACAIVKERDRRKKKRRAVFLSMARI